MGDADVPDWIDTLNHLKELDFDVVLPDHGQAFQAGVDLDAALEAYDVLGGLR